MAGYIINEALIEPPAGWLDGSLNVLRPIDDRQDLKLLVLRIPRGKEPLASAVAQQTKVLSQRLAWFDLLSEGEATVGGRPAYRMRARFKDGAVQLYQHRVTFESHGKLVSIVVAGSSEVTAECDDILERVLSSVELRAQ
jgi:hypothetical protein